jgi:hypothetical protein
MAREGEPADERVNDGSRIKKKEKIILLSVYAGIKLILSAIICFCFRTGPLAFWAALPCHKTAQIICQYIISLLK